MLQQEAQPKSLFQPQQNLAQHLFQTTWSQLPVQEHISLPFRNDICTKTKGSALLSDVRPVFPATKAATPINSGTRWRKSWARGTCLSWEVWKWSKRHQMWDNCWEGSVGEFRTSTTEHCLVFPGWKHSEVSPLLWSPAECAALWWLLRRKEGAIPSGVQTHDALC